MCAPGWSGREFRIGKVERQIRKPFPVYFPAQAAELDRTRRWTISTDWSEREFNANVETKSFYTDGSGEYTPSRQALHGELVDEQLRGHAGQERPRLVLISGGTASGKSEAAKKAQAEIGDAVYTNTDEMRAMLPEFHYVEGTDKAGLLQEEAGDLRDQLLAEAATSRMNVIWDAPGSPSVADRLREIEILGYEITIAYTHRTVEEAKVAAAYRAKHAGNPADRRMVPSEVIEASHRKARAGFALMAAVANREIIIYDKVGKAVGQMAEVIYHRTASGEVLIHDREKVARFANIEEPRISEELF